MGITSYRTPLFGNVIMSTQIVVSNLNEAEKLLTALKVSCGMGIIRGLTPDAQKLFANIRLCLDHAEEALSRRS